MAYNKIDANGETLIDLTSDTVTAGTLLKDVTAHDRSGAQITGTVIVAPTDVTETEDNEAYLYKSSEHDAVYDELVGGSVAWNQLVNPASSPNYNNNGITITNNNDGTYTINGTSTARITYDFSVFTKQDNHVYYTKGCPAGGSSGKYWMGYAGYVIDTGNGGMLKSSDSYETRIRMDMVSGVSFSRVTFTPQFYDLTQMFGSTIADYAYNLEQSTAGSGIAWLKTYGFFTKDYYAYNLGGLVSVNVSGKKVVSETTEVTYPIQSTDLRGLYKLNGSELYTDGDIYSADGQITRKYGIVDLGTLNWQLTSGIFTPTTDIGAKVQSIQGTLANILCPKYVTIQQNQISGKDKVIFGLNWGTGVGIIDSSYTNAAIFKTAMSGVYLIYELATPTTAPAPPFTSPQMVYRNGTEEYLDTRDVPLPVGGNRKYVDIPDWMVNEYFDNIRADSSIIGEIKKEADTLEEHLKAFIIESNIGNPTRINNTRDFTVELFDKIWGTNTDLYPRFAHLYLFGNEAHFLKAIIESIVVDTYTPTYTSEKLIQATFISEMSMYYFRWVRGQAPSMNKYTISVT